MDYVMILQLLVSAGTALMGLKFLTGSVPASYHREIIEAAGNKIEGGHVQVLTAAYRSMGAGFLALAVSLAMIVWFAGSTSWGQAAILLSGLVSLLPILLVTYRTEKASGVRTPWRFAAILLLLLVVAFVLFMGLSR